MPTAPGVQLAQIGVHYSYLGRLTRLLFQPPAILLEMELENGQRMVHRIGRTLLENGLISNRYVRNNADYVRYAKSARYDGLTVRAIRVLPRRWTWGFVYYPGAGRGDSSRPSASSSRSSISLPQPPA